jgi:hypothetical protein
MTPPIDSQSGIRANDDESDGPAARWSHKRGFFYWTVIAIMDPIVALIAAWLWVKTPRER